ncbi:MAG: hypothetical protein PHV34_12160 [Verrucomicrobiae bacterium]|nr:hypothetical protein [Verrucomicrobiae bacterium]
MKLRLMPVFLMTCGKSLFLGLGAAGMFFAFFTVGLRGAVADPVERIKSFATFESIDLQALAGGEVMTQRGPLMKFRRGISGESCYVVLKTVAETSKFIQTSGPLDDGEQGVNFQSYIQLPAKDEDFAKLKLNSERLPIRRLISGTLSASEQKADFAISRTEAGEMARTVKSLSGSAAKPVDIVRACWINVVKGRTAQFFQTGLTKMTSYEMGASEVNPGAEMRSLMDERSSAGIAREFGGLLQDVGLGATAPQNRLQPAINYCELLNWELMSTFDVGAVYSRDLEGGGCQIFDCQYYSSGIYYVSMCFFELWPVKIGGKDATLVWRADLIAAPTLEITRGIERMAYGSLMMKEIKKSIKNFQRIILTK